MEVKDRKNPDY